jgi:methanogenic corrinoid protein MtbC1
MTPTPIDFEKERTMTTDTAPIYNLKAVLKETGIKADVLRAWERRYGMPMPKRSPGGHRLYSPRDVETIKWLIARQNEGLSISRAVELWREIEADARDPLLGSRPSGLTRAEAGRVSPSTGLDALRKSWLEACLAYDEKAAEQVLHQAFATYSPEVVCQDVLQKDMADIGELWYQGKASVQQEHFTSALAMRHVDALISGSPAPTRPQTVLTAAPPGEWHTFSLLLMTLLVRRRGFNVVYLGANVPVDRLEEAVTSVHPTLVVLAAQQLTTAATLRILATRLNQAGVQAAYGGRVFNLVPGIRALIPAHFLGTIIDMSLQTIETLATSSLPVPHGPSIPKSDLALAEEFKRKRPSIELALEEGLNDQNMPAEYLNVAAHFFGDSLAAALELGNADYIETELYWLLNLLPYHKVSPAALSPFLRAYSDATSKVMSQDAKRLTAWIDLFASKVTSAVLPRQAPSA